MKAAVLFQLLAWGPAALADHEVSPENADQPVLVSWPGGDVVYYPLEPGSMLTYETPGPIQVTLEVRQRVGPVGTSTSTRIHVLGDGVRFMTVDATAEIDESGAIYGEDERLSRETVARLEVPAGGKTLGLEAPEGGPAFLVRVETDQPVPGAEEVARRRRAGIATVVAGAAVAAGAVAATAGEVAAVTAPVKAPPLGPISPPGLPPLGGATGPLRSLEAGTPEGDEPAETVPTDLALSRSAQEYADMLDEPSPERSAEPAGPVGDDFSDLDEPAPRTAAARAAETDEDTAFDQDTDRKTLSTGLEVGVGAPARGDTAVFYAGIRGRSEIVEDRFDLSLAVGWYRIGVDQDLDTVDPYAGALKYHAQWTTDVVPVTVDGILKPVTLGRVAPIVGGGLGLYVARRTDGDTVTAGPGVGTQWFGGADVDLGGSYLTTTLSWNGLRHDFGSVDAAGDPARETLATARFNLAYLVRF